MPWVRMAWRSAAGRASALELEARAGLLLMVALLLNIVLLGQRVPNEYPIDYNGGGGGGSSSG
eukprot:2941407-Amphidinium_carterae.1